MGSLKTLAITAVLVIGVYAASTTVAQAESGLVWVHCDDGSASVRVITPAFFSTGRSGCRPLDVGLDAALRRACEVKKAKPKFTWPQYGNRVAGKVWTCK